MMVRFFDGARRDAYRDDPDRLILIEDSVIFGRGKRAARAGSHVAGSVPSMLIAFIVESPPFHVELS